MVTSSPIPAFCHAKMEHEPPVLRKFLPSSGDLMSPDSMHIDPPETPAATRHITRVTNEAISYTRDMARSMGFDGTDSHQTSQSRSQSAGIFNHTSPSSSILQGDIDSVFGLPARSVGFSDLPDDLQDRIFTILLKGEDEISLSTSWLMTFVNTAAGTPVLKEENSRRGTMKSASVLRSDLKQTNTSLKAIPDEKWPRDPAKSQTGVLTRSLLTVSKVFHERASRIFYGSNTFNFTHRKTCWMHLKPFLATIGSKNVSHICHICLRAPTWHPGVRRDAIVGALFDAMGPVTRLAAFKVPAEDRLLSAINNCARSLGESGNLESLQMDVRVQG